MFQQNLLHEFDLGRYCLIFLIYIFMFLNQIIVMILR